MKTSCHRGEDTHKSHASPPQIWIDSTCGDGICAYNTLEYPSFGRFGCPADCGLMAGGGNLTALEVMIQPVYKRNELTTAAMQADFLAKTSWNLCFDLPSWRATGEYECWRVPVPLRAPHCPYQQHRTTLYQPLNGMSHLTHAPSADALVTLRLHWFLAPQV